MFYGLLKEPDLNIPVEDDDDGGGDGEDKPKVCCFDCIQYHNQTFKNTKANSQNTESDENLPRQTR